MDRFLSISELAARWSVSDKHVRRLLRNMQVPSVDVGIGSRKQLRIPLSGILDFETSRTQRPKEKARPRSLVFKEFV